MVYLSYGLLSFFNKENDMYSGDKAEWDPTVEMEFKSGTRIIVESCVKGFEVFAYKGEGSYVINALEFDTLEGVFEWAREMSNDSFDIKFEGYLYIIKKETL
jgi:hypothetical protein